MYDAFSKVEVITVSAHDQAVTSSEVHQLEARVRELERLLDRKTMEVDSLLEALDLARFASEIVLGNLSDLLSRLQTPQVN